MANCFPADHQLHDPPPDVVALVTSTLDKLTRNTFEPALATQTTLLESVALDHAKPLPTKTGQTVAGPVEMHLDQSKTGRARLNARKKALAGRRVGDVRVLGVDAESRGGVGLSEEIRNALDDEFSDEAERAVRTGSGSGSDSGSAAMNVDPPSEEDVPLPPTQAFGQSNLQAKMQHRSGSRGLFEAENQSAEQPFRAGEADRLDGSASRNETIKTFESEDTRDDRDIKRRNGGGEEGSALATKFGLGRDHVRAGVEWGLVGPRKSLWEAASGL